MDILVIDIGGTTVKLWHTAHEEHRRFESGKSLTPEQMVEQTLAAVQDWQWEAVALGLPCRVSNGRPIEDPHNLGPGWVGYNFASALSRPVRIMNDASLQALGSYDGGRMLFLGLGTAVGSTFITLHLILSLDLGRLPYGKERLFELLGDEGFETLGTKKWQNIVLDVVPALKTALMADYVVLGGGSVKRLDELPDSVRRGHNRTVVEGGRKLWEELPDPTQNDSSAWIIM
ncbi:MAG: ROK family protein [Planctomycetes bacterium]|nr:ROK family protein [Planctomycetota bacterium]